MAIKNNVFTTWIIQNGTKFQGFMNGHLFVKIYKLYIVSIDYTSVETCEKLEQYKISITKIKY